MKQLAIVGGVIALGIGLYWLNKQQLPRGIRNNNPGNIIKTNDVWEGSRIMQTDPKFVQFKNPKYGFRAMVRILRAYNERGLNTVDSIIRTWANDISEDEKAAYVESVARRLNVDPFTQLDIESRMLGLLRAIATHENGADYESFYSDRVMSEGVLLA